MAKQLVNRLNRRISFFKTVTKKDDDGDLVKQEDVILFSCWSEFFSQSVQDKTASIGTVYEDTVFFNVAAQMEEKIDNSMKIRFKEKKYSIISIDLRPSEELVRITAKAVS